MTLYRISHFIIHPCDPTVVICYLIWPCDIAVQITYLISHSSSLSYNTVITGYFQVGCIINICMDGEVNTSKFYISVPVYSSKN